VVEAVEVVEVVKVLDERANWPNEINLKQPAFKYASAREFLQRGVS
jgi:hypothetical protein